MRTGRWPAIRYHSAGAPGEWWLTLGGCMYDLGLLIYAGGLWHVYSPRLAKLAVRRTVELRQLVEAHGQMVRLPERSFEASGTGVSTLVVALDRPLVEPDPVPGEPVALTLDL